MSFSKVLSVIASAVFLLGFMPLDVFAQPTPSPVPLPVPPEVADSPLPGPLIECFIQTSPSCSNFVVPREGTCSGSCQPFVVYDEEHPNGFLVHKCPTGWEESLINGQLVDRVRQLLSNIKEAGFARWLQTPSVDCITYDYCLCITNPNGTGAPICDPCGCGHTVYPVEQSHVTGAICNEQTIGE